MVTVVPYLYANRATSKQVQFRGGPVSLSVPSGRPHRHKVPKQRLSSYGTRGLSCRARPVLLSHSQLRRGVHMPTNKQVLHFWRPMGYGLSEWSHPQPQSSSVLWSAAKQGMIHQVGATSMVFGYQLVGSGRWSSWLLARSESRSILGLVTRGSAASMKSE